MISSADHAIMRAVDLAREPREARMKADVTTSDGVILLDVKRPEPCCLTLEAHEALDLAQQLLAAAVEISAPPRFEAHLVRPW